MSIDGGRQEKQNGGNHSTLLYVEDELLYKKHMSLGHIGFDLKEVTEEKYNMHSSALLQDSDKDEN